MALPELPDPHVGWEPPGGDETITFIAYPDGEELGTTTVSRLAQLIGTRDPWARIADMIQAGTLLPSDDPSTYWVTQVPDLAYDQAVRDWVKALSAGRAARARAGLS